MPQNRAAGAQFHFKQIRLYLKVQLGYRIYLNLTRGGWGVWGCNLDKIKKSQENAPLLVLSRNEQYFLSVLPGKTLEQTRNWNSPSLKHIFILFSPKL